MDVVAGVVVIALSLPCWGGQVVSWFFPSVAQRWKLTEAPESVDPVFAADVRGEARWDAMTLWTMPLAGLLLMVGSEAWSYLGLVAGGMYIYFGGRGIASRMTIKAEGHRIGAPDYLPTAYGALAMWTLLGFAVVAGAVAVIV